MAARAPAAAPSREVARRGVDLVYDGVHVIRHEAELAAIRDAWLRLQHDQIAADPDFFVTSLRVDPKIVRPHVLALVRDGAVDAMLVGRIEQAELPVRLGYGTIYAPKLRSLTIVYGGILGHVDEDVFRLLLGSLRESLRKREADVVAFRWLPVDSPFSRIASTEPPFLSRQHVSQPETHWELTLPRSVDDILKPLSSGSRSGIRRYARRVESEFGDGLSVRIFKRPDELDDFFRDVETVAATTYQRGLGVSFGDTPPHRERARCCMERGWFRGYVLYRDGRPCAFHHGELYGGRFRHGRPGYDPQFADLRVGTYLLLKMFDDLCRDDEARVVDYGIGEAEFKNRFGTASWLEANVVIVAPTVRATSINVLRTVLLLASRGARRILGRGKLFHMIRRGWRRRLRAPGA
jgi:CelD/BcsL family acetyltransferase involved in cellulose biosynthesis